jgi:riboflavin synthase
MFTGIVEATGSILRLSPSLIEIEFPSSWRGRLLVGGSVAVNGVCLTMRGIEERSFSSDLSRETWARTTFGALHAGVGVNLELPLSPSDRLDGHWVLGHIDGVGHVRSLTHERDAWSLVISFSPQARRYVVDKGSIAVDGVSLTPFDVREDTFRCAIIPETYERTCLRERRPGDPVNLEYDVLAKYIERMMRHVHTD